MDRRTWLFVLGGLIVAVAVAAIASGFASGEPDGLEKVSIDQGFDEAAGDHAMADSPLADYSVTGIENERVSTGVAGVIGVTATLALTVGLLYGIRAVRRRRQQQG
jgi:hypothetical protein